MRRSRPARDLRTAIDCLPLKTRRAMLGGVEANRIIVGAYTDRSTGVRGRRPRPATDRELTTLTTMLEASIALDELPTVSEVVREAKATRAARRLRVFRRFDEYERAVAELATIRALNRPDEGTEARESRSAVTS